EHAGTSRPSPSTSTTSFAPAASSTSWRPCCPSPSPTRPQAPLRTTRRPDEPPARPRAPPRALRGPRRPRVRRAPHHRTPRLVLQLPGVVLPRHPVPGLRAASTSPARRAGRGRLAAGAGPRRGHAHLLQPPRRRRRLRQAHLRSPRPAGGDPLSRIPCPVETCDRPMPGSRAICGACEADIARALASVPGVCADLDVTLARQTSRTTAGKTSAVVPLPYDPRASEAAWVLRSTLAGWVRQLQDAKPEDGPAGTPQSIAAWLTQRLQRLRSDEHTNSSHVKISYAVS